MAQGKTGSYLGGEIRKVRIDENIVIAMERLMERYPNQLPNLTAAVNFVLGASLPLVTEDLDNMKERLQKRWVEASD